MNGNNKSGSREQRPGNPHQWKVFATMRPDPWSEAESFSPVTPSATDTGSPAAAKSDSDTLPYAASMAGNADDELQTVAAPPECLSSPLQEAHGSRLPASESSAPIHVRSAISSWVGQAGSLQIRKCLVGGEISGVQQQVLTEQSPASQSDHRSEYAIQNRLGKGGMGNVYRAQQTSLNRPLAVKRCAVTLQIRKPYSGCLSPKH